MKIKNFVRHTRPHGEKEIRQTILDLAKQINYLKGIGHTENIEYYKWELARQTARLLALPDKEEG